MKNFDRQTSDAFYLYKFLAIISVVMAHCTYQNVTLQRITSLLGILGVPMFLMASGYYFQYKADNKSFWLKKLRGLVIPWFVWSIFTYLMDCLFKEHGFDLVGFLKWTYGFQNWLYFVPMLLLCYAMFKISNQKIYRGALFVLFLLSNVLSIVGIISSNAWFTPYLMVFNWCGFFQMGIFFKAHFEAVAGVLKNKIFMVFSILAFIALGVFAVLNGMPTYWEPYSLLFEILGMIVLFYPAYLCRNAKLLSDVGKYTYLIYFIHMQIGLSVFHTIADLLNISRFEWVLLVFKPLIIIFAVYGGVRLVDWLSKKWKLKFMWVFGLKT